jgi:RimJ/RimL family protein N-acetyltransferase
MEVEVKSPFPFEALPRVWRWIEPFKEKVSDDFSPQNEEQFLSFMAGKWKVQKTWAVYGNGELGGLIQFERLTPWLGTAHFLLKREFQGLSSRGERPVGKGTGIPRQPGIAIQACRIAAADIFENEGVGKLTFNPFAHSLAIASILINLGAKREGTLTGHTLCGGKPTDMWVYGLTKEGFQEKQNARVDQ